MMPFCLPEERPPEEMPFQTRVVFHAAEELRVLAVQALGQTWEAALPRVPLTRGELRELLKARFLKDEQAVLKQLAGLGSQSEGIITALELTRGIIKEALHRLRGDRAAQITLAAIISATRFRIYRHGRPLATRCGNCRVREDSFTHLVVCHSLQNEVQKGAQSVDFLVDMATAAVLTPPGSSVPFVRDL